MILATILWLLQHRMSLYEANYAVDNLLFKLCALNRRQIRKTWELVSWELMCWAVGCAVGLPRASLPVSQNDVDEPTACRSVTWRWVLSCSSTGWLTPVRRRVVDIVWACTLIGSRVVTYSWLEIADRWQLVDSWLEMRRVYIDSWQIHDALQRSRPF